MLESLRTVDELEDHLSRPTPAAVEALSRLPGDLILLGVGGKMGPTLARMARRASTEAGTSRRIFGVSRFTDPTGIAWLKRYDVEPIAADLLDPAALAALPDVPNVIWMTGMKFGSTGNESRTWAMNVWLPGAVCNKFRHSRIVAFSTGNVYGLTPVLHGGSVESDPPRPTGEYAMSTLGRERMFEHFSRTHQIPMAILRLNYACEMRYGVLVDLAQQVWAGQTIDLNMGHFNTIWQADANAAALAVFAHLTTPPLVVNLAGPELLSVRRVCERLGELMQRPVTFTGTEGHEAYLSNGQRGQALFGYPRVGVEQMLRWVADWIREDGPLLGKPTHFDNRRGDF